MPEKDKNEVVEFELEELEQKIAPSLVTACGGCTGCSQPGCSTCAADQISPASN